MPEETRVGLSYGTKNSGEQQAVYDDWALQYEQDLFAMGNKTPIMCPVIFAHFVDGGEKLAKQDPKEAVKRLNQLPHW